VLRLALTHISARYAEDARPLEREARAVFRTASSHTTASTIEVPHRDASDD
jgi:ribonuclease BN (tRNA processing enzyme)